MICSSVFITRYAQHTLFTYCRTSALEIVKLTIRPGPLLSIKPSENTLTTHPNMDSINAKGVK